MLKIDLHLHTILSGHAHNTILEYIHRAKELGMDVIGISDHGPAIKGMLTNEVYFRSLIRLPRVVDNIKILRGIEANIINSEGKIDVTGGMSQKLDYIMVGFHENAGYENLGFDKNT